MHYTATWWSDNAKLLEGYKASTDSISQMIQVTLWWRFWCNCSWPAVLLPLGSSCDDCRCIRLQTQASSIRNKASL